MNIIQEMLQFNAKIRGFEYTDEELRAAEHEALVENIGLYDEVEICCFVNRKIMERAH